MAASQVGWFSNQDIGGLTAVNGDVGGWVRLGSSAETGHTALLWRTDGGMMSGHTSKISKVIHQGCQHLGDLL